ncbi:MAG: YARHG domain-containing protein [Pseudomonadota bacterium]
MSVFWQFLQNKSNREVISWIGGGCVLVAGGLYNFVGPEILGLSKAKNAPVEVVKAETKTSTRKTHRCSNESDYRTGDNGQVLGHSDARLVSADELLKYNPCQLWLAKNEIYARRGRPFKHTFLHTHFSGQDWYQSRSDWPKPDDTQQRNIDLIDTYLSRLTSN